MKKLIFLGCIILLTQQSIHGQIGDWQSRIGLEAGFKLTKKWSFDFGVQTRSNLSDKSYLSTNISMQVDYAVFKNCKLGLSYRNSMQPNEFAYLDGNNLSYRNRYQFFLKIDPSKLLKLDKYLDVDLRSIMQYEQFQYKRNQIYWRNRISLEAKLKSKLLRPYVSLELLYRFNQYSYFLDNMLVNQGLMNELRYIGGIKFNLNKNNTINTALMFRDYRTNKNTKPVFLITYSHNFGRIF